MHRAVHIYDWLDSTSPAATICATDPVTTHDYSFPHLRMVLTLLCHTWEVFSRAVSLVKPQDGSFTSSEQPTSTLHHLLYTAVIQFQPKHSDILSLLRYLQMRGEKNSWQQHRLCCMTTAKHAKSPRYCSLPVSCL